MLLVMLGLGIHREGRHTMMMMMMMIVVVLIIMKV